MSQMTITIILSQAAQRAALLAGQDAHREQTYEVPAEFAERMLALPQARLSPDGDVDCKIMASVGFSSAATDGTVEAEPSWHSTCGYGSCEMALATRPADGAEALAAVEVMVAAARAHVQELAATGKAARQARQAGERVAAERWAALPLSHRATVHGVGVCRPWDSEADYSGPLLASGTRVYEGDDLRRYAPAAWDEAESEAERLRTEAEAEAERQAAEKAEQKATATALRLAEQAVWIAEHGSERLQLAVATGLLSSSQAVYQEERLAVERPGWEWELEESRLGDIRNPALLALEALRLARAAYGEGVQLRFARLDRDEERARDYDGEEWGFKGPALYDAHYPLGAILQRL